MYLPRYYIFVAWYYRVSVTTLNTKGNEERQKIKPQNWKRVMAKIWTIILKPISWSSHVDFKFGLSWSPPSVLNISTSNLQILIIHIYN